MENSVDDVGNRIGEGFDGIRQEVAQKTQEIRDTVQAFVDENPLGAVGIAFGVGYLLSGALVSRLTARVVGIGGRILLGNLLRQAVAGLGPGILLEALRGAGAQSAVGGRGDDGTSGPGGGRRTQTERH